MVDDAWGRAAFLVVGWLLGILSPAIIETIRRARDLKPMQDSLAEELHEFRFTVACVASVLRTHLGTADRDFHQWLKKVSDDYRGVMASGKFREAAGVYLKLSDDELAAVSRYQAAGEHGGLSLKKLAVVGLDARLSSLWMFPRTAQSELLRLLADLSIHNEEVAAAEHYHKLTFQLQSTNHQIARTNLLSGYRNLAGIAQRLADQAHRCEVGLRSGNWPQERKAYGK